MGYIFMYNTVYPERYVKDILEVPFEGLTKELCVFSAGQFNGTHVI
jgi:hypothetical protein